MSKDKRSLVSRLTTVKIMTLKNLVQLYESKVEDKEKVKLLGMNVLDTPPKGFLSYNEAVEKFNPQPGDTIFALVPVKDIWGDTTYNRVERIHYGNIAKNLKSRGGFSYKSSGAVSLFARPNGRLVATKGNHRVTKRYAISQDPDALIPAEITFHTSEKYEDIIQTEASDHNVDCNYRTTQNTDDRFKAAYHAGEQWAVNLYRYLDKFGIGIAETNTAANYEASSYRAITKSRDLNEEVCSRYLGSFTSVVSVDELGGIATFAATSFLDYFKNSVKYIDENNNVDSIEGFLDYIYNKRSDFSHGFLDDVNQAKLTEGNGKFKGEEVNVARLISLYNEYCLKVLRAKIPTSNKDAIGYSSNEYLEFIKKADETVRSRVDEIARQTI
jgi:hypothetical protein